MIKTLWKVGSAVLCGAGLLANSGCCHSASGSCVTKAPCKTTTVVAVNKCEIPPGEISALPPNAKPGECWAKVWIPPTYRTVSERVIVKPASERVEITPAEYGWVEERVMVKEESRELQAIPAEFATRERTVVVEPAHTDWEVNKAANCELPKNTPAKDVFCLVEHPPVIKTVSEEYMVKPASVQERVIPAEFETVKRQKLVRAASTKKVCIPAEYATIDKQVKECDGRLAWQRVVCEEPAGHALSSNTPIRTETTIIEREPLTMNNAPNASPDRINAVKNALRAKGYAPGPMNGEIRARDWVAINKFQRDHNLPVGDLNNETLRELGV